MNKVAVTKDINTCIEYIDWALADTGRIGETYSLKEVAKAAVEKMILDGIEDPMRVAAKALVGLGENPELWNELKRRVHPRSGQSFMVLHVMMDSAWCASHPQVFAELDAAYEFAQETSDYSDWRSLEVKQLADRAFAIADAVDYEMDIQGVK